MKTLGDYMGGPGQTPQAVSIVRTDAGTDAGTTPERPSLRLSQS